MIYPRDIARDGLQRVLFNRWFSPFRPRLASLLSRVHNHLYNCSTNPRANGENWLVSQLPRGGVFLDVGFNRGTWTRQVLQQCPRAFVHGFDPSLEVRDMVERLCLPPSRFAFHPIALSRESGRALFYDYGDLHEMSSLVSRASEIADVPRSYDVDVSTLDEWTEKAGRPFIDVVKVDAEGYDLHILEGARALLARQGVGLIVFEYGSGWFATKRTLLEAAELFSSTGYRLFRLFPHFLAPYRYRVQHEGTLMGYFVALSEKVSGSAIPCRELEL